MSGPEHQIVAQLIRAMRTEAGLKQADLAARLDTTQSEVSKYETGERRVEILELRDICDACGVRLKDFVERLEAQLKGKRHASK